MPKKKILVTGGAGFLGSHLCDKLLKEGNAVICLDNLLTGQKENILHLMDHPDFEFIQEDVISFSYKSHLDEIYNLACPASPEHYKLDPIQTIKTTVMGTIKMLELAKKTRAKFLQASTSEIYGDPEIHPQPESYWGNVNPIGERSCYNEAKRCAETLCYNYKLQHHLDVKIARIFNTYGPRMHLSDGRVVSNFIVQALQNKSLTIYGDGSQTRSFCYVDDLVEGLLQLMASSDDFMGPVNLGNPVEISMLNLARKIVDKLNSHSEIVFSPLPTDDPKRRRPDIDLAEKSLNWKPRVSLDTGLQETINYFKSIIRI